MPNKHIDRIKYTDGSNGIVRLPPELWMAFYTAALYLDYDAVQDCFMDYLAHSYAVYANLDWVTIVTRLETDEIPF